MGYSVLFARADIQVLSPTLVADTERVTISTTPTGIIMDYQVPRPAFDNDQGAGLLSNLADSIENLVSGGLAVGGFGEQLVDPVNNLLVDAVTFVVSYQPPDPGAQPRTTTVTVPVDIITADPAFASQLAGGSAQERLLAAYNNLRDLGA